MIIRKYTYRYSTLMLITVFLSCTNKKKNESLNVEKKEEVNSVKPVVISTWNHGVPANEEAWKVLETGGNALDAVELGVRTAEANPDIQTVGLGGFPDREGNVTLDACIMDHNSNCGAVSFLQHIKHPISVARKVMENTPHIMLTGEAPYSLHWNRVLRKKTYLLLLLKKHMKNGCKHQITNQLLI